MTLFGRFTLLAPEPLFQNPYTQVEVWHARDENGNEVALKLIPREMDNFAQELRTARFQAEVAAGRSQKHERVRKLLDHGTEDYTVRQFNDGVDWIAFQWIDGGTLEALLHKRSKSETPGLSAKELQGLTRAIANALSSLHRADPIWIHRDVKPANILLPREDCRDALLADMGIARQVGSQRLTREAGHGVSGTFPYMSPEHLADSDSVGPLADIYSLAVVLWECVSGSIPRCSSRSSYSDVRKRYCQKVCKSERR